MPLAHSSGVFGWAHGPSKRPDESDVHRLLETQYDKAEFQYDWTVNDRHNKKRSKEITL